MVVFPDNARLYIAFAMSFRSACEKKSLRRTWYLMLVKKTMQIHGQERPYSLAVYGCTSPLLLLAYLSLYRGCPDC